jgi:hypothetical protein
MDKPQKISTGKILECIKKYASQRNLSQTNFSKKIESGSISLVIEALFIQEQFDNT